MSPIYKYGKSVSERFVFVAGLVIAVIIGSLAAIAFLILSFPTLDKIIP